MATVAVNFIYGSTTTSFYDDEILQLDVISHQPRIEQRLKNGKSSILLTGEKYRTIEITFLTSYSDTAAKIELLKAQDSMTCYYRKIIDGSIIKVKMIKNDVPRLYYSGRKSGGDEIKCEFYEILSGVAIHRKRIGV